jgi:hypothetical protein
MRRGWKEARGGRGWEEANSHFSRVNLGHLNFLLYNKAQDKFSILSVEETTHGLDFHACLDNSPNVCIGNGGREELREGWR